MNPPSHIASSLLVAIGGGAGASLRHLVERLSLSLLGPNAATAFPWSTLTVNALGSFAMGLLAGWLARHGHGGEAWRLLLGVGVLGGFTTFSAFSLEVVLLAERGQYGLATVYVALSVIGGVLGLFGGLLIMRSVG